MPFLLAVPSHAAQGGSARQAPAPSLHAKPCSLPLSCFSPSRPHQRSPSPVSSLGFTVPQHTAPPRLHETLTWRPLVPKASQDLPTLCIFLQKIPGVGTGRALGVRGRPIQAFPVFFCPPPRDTGPSFPCRASSPVPLRGLRARRSCSWMCRVWTRRRVAPGSLVPFKASPSRAP